MCKQWAAAAARGRAPEWGYRQSTGVGLQAEHRSGATGRALEWGAVAFSDKAVS